MGLESNVLNCGECALQGLGCQFCGGEDYTDGAEQDPVVDAVELEPESEPGEDDIQGDVAIAAV